MDTGRPPPLAVSQEAHAGCLSFELSWKQHRLVVNCGLPAVNRENWRQVARATAGAFDRHVQRHLVVPLPRIAARCAACCSALRSSAGPRNVQVAREDTPTAHHAARLARRLCRRFRHRPPPRRCGSRADGRALDGEDSFSAAAGRRPAARRRDDFAVRFHLHPAVKANRLTDGHGVILLLPDREVWTFDAYGDDGGDRGERLSSPARTARAAPCRSSSTATPASSRGCAGASATRRRRGHGAPPEPRRRAGIAAVMAVDAARLSRSASARSRVHSRVAHDQPPAPHHPRSAVGLRQDRACRFRPALAGYGVELVSTGGTAKALKDAGLKVRRRRRAHRLSRDDGRPGEDAAPEGARRPAGDPRQHGARRRDGSSTASSRSTCWWSISIRSRRRSPKAPLTTTASRTSTSAGRR